MSRNKFILLFAILVIIYLVMPSEGIYGSIKANVILALPFLMIGVIIYLFTTVIVMRRAWRKLDNNEQSPRFIYEGQFFAACIHEGEGTAVSGYETQETGCTASWTGCFRR